jgi:hypothetical protein
MTVTATSGNTNNAGLSYLPNQIVDEYKDENYIETARFIANQWNLPVYYSTQWSLPANEIGLPLGFAARSMIWRDYYFGVQSNIDYSYLSMNENGQRLLLKLFRGKDIFKYVNYTIEPIIDLTKKIPKVLMCTTVSENVVSKRRFLLDFGKFQKDQEEMLNYMNEAFGIYLQTPSGTKFIKNAQQEIVAVDFREDLADGAVNAAKDIYFRNFLNEVFVEVGKDALISGLAGVHVSIVNGYPLVERIPSYEAIFSPAINGDQHRQDPFGGRLRFMTVQEIAARWGSDLGQETLKEIQGMANQTSSLPIGGLGWNYYNNVVGSSAFNWWNLVDGVPRIAVLECQYASYKKSQIEDGSHKQTNRECVLIGNKYLINQKISENQTKDWRNPVATDLDYLFCSPMSVYGKNMGIPEILYNYVNRVDFLQTKLDYWINQTKGTFYLINGSYLEEGVDATQVVSDISSMRVHVTKGMDTDAGETVQKFMQQGAIEMPRDVVNVINQISMYRNMMADVLNIPDAARGIMEGYVPQKTLNAQIGQSAKGTRYFYDPLFTFYNRVIQKAVDKFKTSTLDNPDFEYNLIISDSQTEQFKATKEFGMSQYAMYIGFEDVADEGYKQRMMDMAFAYAQNPQSGYTWADISAIESMYTKGEINNYLQYRDFEIKQERMAQEQAIAQQQQQAAEQNNATQENITAMNNEGADARTNAQIESKEAIEEAKIEADLIKAQQNQ